MHGISLQREEYFNGLESLGLCKTVEDFWQIYLSLPIIGSENASRYYLFKVLHTHTILTRIISNRPGNTNGIVKEDGSSFLYTEKIQLPIFGRFLFISRSLLTIQLLTTIGEQFDVGNEICGVSVSVKRNACTFMVWNKTASYEKAINKIEQEWRVSLIPG